MTNHSKTAALPEQRLLSAWVPLALAEEIDRRAARHERSRAGELRLAVRRYLDEPDHAASTGMRTA